MFFLSFALLCKPNLMSSLLWFITVNHFSLMLKLLAFFDEATVLLYFAQSVLVKISTNSLSAELRRRIMMAKRDMYVKQNRIRAYVFGFAVIIWEILRSIMENSTHLEHLRQKISEKDICFILLAVNHIILYTNSGSQHMITWKHCNKATH